MMSKAESSRSAAASDWRAWTAPPPSSWGSHLSTDPPIAFVVAADADGRSARITPTEPLTAGTLYRFKLTADDGRLLDSWAFQAHQPLRIVATVPANTQTDVATNTGIEVTFDQDGVVDAASHMSIDPKIGGRFEQHGRTLAFVPAKRLRAATIYTVTVTRGVAARAPERSSNPMSASGSRQPPRAPRARCERRSSSRMTSWSRPRRTRPRSPFGSSRSRTIHN